jgi:DNA primase
MANFFEAIALDDASRERLCRDLLAEFGVTHVKVTSRGEMIHSCCLPFGRHANGDRKPSASLNYRKLTYKCLGCGGKGGILWFIAVCRGLDGPQARKWLGEQTGMDGNVMELATLLRAIDAMFEGKAVEVPTIPEYPTAILDRWEGIHPYLTDGDPESGLPGRNVPEATLKHFRVGYAPDYFMGAERASQERIVIPQFWRGKLVGWQARRIDDEDEPKYKNSVEFPKDFTIYNFDPDDPGDVVLVESPLSVLRHWHHQPGLAATFGKDLTDWQIRLLRRCRSLVYWPDPDEAGWNAAEYAIEHLSRYVSIRIVNSPYDVDPGDMHEDEVVDRLIGDALPWGLWKRPERLIRWEK